MKQRFIGTKTSHHIRSPTTNPVWTSAKNTVTTRRWLLLLLLPLHEGMLTMLKSFHVSQPLLRLDSKPSSLFGALPVAGCAKQTWTAHMTWDK